MLAIASTWLAHYSINIVVAIYSINMVGDYTINIVMAFYSTNMVQARHAGPQLAFKKVGRDYKYPEVKI